jgi:hypothetical protein
MEVKFRLRLKVQEEANFRKSITARKKRKQNIPVARKNLVSSLFEEPRTNLVTTDR